MLVGCCTNPRWVARFHVTVLSVEVEAALLLPARSVARLAGIVAMIVPEIVMPVTATL